jgi:hypothetical protein
MSPFVHVVTMNSGSFSTRRPRSSVGGSTVTDTIIHMELRAGTIKDSWKSGGEVDLHSGITMLCSDAWEGYPTLSREFEEATFEVFNLASEPCSTAGS